MELAEAIEGAGLRAEGPVASALVVLDLGAGLLHVALPFRDGDLGSGSHLPLELRLPGLVDADGVDEGTDDLLPAQLPGRPDVARDLVVRLELVEVRPSEDGSRLVLEDEDLAAELHEA